MSNMSLNRAYLWKRNSSSRYPWDRKFLNTDFLEFEKKRINDVSVWWKEFYKKRIGDQLDEVLYYVLPAEFSSNIKASVSILGEYHIIQLSALKNSEQMGMIMILPRDKKLPQDYSLIRITNSKKDVLIKFLDSGPIYIINVENYEVENPLIVYYDLSSKSEENVVYKFLKENIIRDDKYKALSFQSPISSSPFVKDIGGGISLSSYSPRYSFSDEFLKTLKMIQPPEITNIHLDYPRSVFSGKTVVGSIPGVSFKLRDIPSPGKNIFSCFASPSFELLKLELKRKETFNGEYSIACSLNDTSSTASQRLREILSKFASTDITNTIDIEDLKYNNDLYLPGIQDRINEELWIQIANQKRNSPAIDDNIDEQYLRKKVREDYFGILESLGIKNPNEEEISLYSTSSFENIKRVAQSIARDRNIKLVDKKIIDESYTLFVKNYNELIGSVGVQKAVEGVDKEQKSKVKEMLQVSLSMKAQTLNELFEEIGTYFGNDILKLQVVLDQLKREGMIYEPIRGYYKWI